MVRVGFPKQGHSEAKLTFPTIQSRSAGQRQRYLGWHPCVCNHDHQAQSEDAGDEEEDDDITLRLSLVSADSRSHLCFFVPLEILSDYHEEDDEKIKSGHCSMRLT